MLDKKVKVGVTVAGVHNWPEAPEHRGYLAHPHRHEFRIFAIYAVRHADRDVEFHDAQDSLRTTVMSCFLSHEGLVDFGSCSCESIAAKLLGQLSARGAVQVEVAEDADCAATVSLPHVPPIAEAKPVMPTIVVLCGSTRFEKGFRQAEAALERWGYAVFSVGSFPNATGETLDPKLKELLDNLHLLKIKMADWVMVVDGDQPGDLAYIGESTRREIEYARSLKKPISVWRDYAKSL